MSLFYNFKTSVWLRANQLSKVDSPIQILCGEADKLVSTRNLEKWKSIFLTVKVVRFRNVAQFFADEALEFLTLQLAEF